MIFNMKLCKVTTQHIIIVIIIITISTYCISISKRCHISNRLCVKAQ